MTHGPTMTGKNHELGELDILCSKDKSLSNHPGNRLFRELIEDAKASYNKATDKASKMKITKSIVDCLQKDHGCRFVKFDCDLAEWVELNPVESRDKVGHALRFAIKRTKVKATKVESRSASIIRHKASLTKMAMRRMSDELLSSSFSSSSPRLQSTIAPRSCSEPAIGTTVTSKTPQALPNTRRPSLSSLSISYERIQSARQKLDQIFERQNKMVQSMQMGVTADGPVLPHNGIGMGNWLHEHTRSSSTKLLSSCSDEVIDIFSSKELDMMVGDMEAV